MIGILIVNKINNTNPITYTLTHLNSEGIIGILYENELSKTGYTLIK